ncbi:MAG: hypothetical protein JO323_06630 [Acidobacteriia bacterium]|nr:hypothetical protein [Terriglobia bacterium]
MSEELSQKLIDKLSASKSPVGYTALKKELVRKKAGVSEELLRNLLESAVTAGNVFRWGDYARKKQCYWTTSREAFFDDAIVEACAQQALAPSEIRIPGLPPKTVTLRLKELVGEHRLKEFPRIGGEKKRFGTSPESYASALRAFVKTKLSNAGLDESLFFGPVAVAGASDGMEDRILDALRRLEPAPNVPVASVALRRELEIKDSQKAEFDQALLQLRDQKLVYLSRHDNPHALLPEDRNKLIDGGDGIYYVAANLRADS